MSIPSLYLCVDCGGTKTSAVICNDTGEIVGRALGGPSNFSYLGLKLFIRELQATVEKALSSSDNLFSGGTDLSMVGRFTSVWIGVSGVDSPNDIQTLTAALSPMFDIPPGRRFQVTNDANLLASPLRSHPELQSAVAVIAGTGSVVISFSKTEDQGSSGQGTTALFREMARVGGWGWILGDVGSGFEVGREAIREILTRADRLAVDGYPATDWNSKSLQSRILSHFGITTVPDLFGVIYAPDPLSASACSGDPSAHKEARPPEAHSTLSLSRERRLSQLSPIVFQAAFEDKDELALTVLKRCAGNLAHIIASVLLPCEKDSSIPRNAVKASSSILCLGGSLVGISAYRDLVLEELFRLGHIFPAVDYVGGGDVAAAGAKGLALAGSL
ncbi:hypothetical protein K439DRAFT_1411754 [Ramaria rubella]|nr:hypothetical protein K439DRAFT_1411754 [Ramaria rubella]